MILQNKRLAVVTFLCFSGFSVFSQSTNRFDEILESAKDSVFVNPDFTCNVLDELISIGVSDTLGISEMVDKSEYYCAIKQWDSAMYYAKKALPLNKSKKKESKLYRILGSSTRRKPYDIKATMTWYKKGLAVAEKHKFKLVSQMIRADITKINQGLENMEDAIRSLDPGYMLKGNSNEKFYKLKLKRAIDYYKSGNIQAAEDSFYQILMQHNNANFIKNKAALYKVLASIHTIKGNYYSAYKKYTEAHTALVKSSAYSNLPNLKIKMNKASNYKKDFEAISNTLTSLLAQGKRSHDLDLQKEIYEYKLEFYDVLKNEKNHEEYTLEYYHLRNAIDRTKSQKKIKDLQFQYEIAMQIKNVKELSTLSEKQSLQLKTQKETITSLLLAQKLKEEQDKNSVLILKNKDYEIKRQKQDKITLLVASLTIIIVAIILLLIYNQKLKAQIALNKIQEQMSEQKLKSIKKDQELILIKNTIEAEDKERERIARELHDSIAGDLAAIKLQLNHHNGNFKSIIKSLKIQLDRTYELVRALSHKLMPKQFTDTDFTVFLEDYLRRNAKNAGFTLYFNGFPKKEINVIDYAIQEEVFKIVQELFVNSVKYAKAQKLDIQLTMNESVLKLIFEDDGVGFDTEIKKGLGLRNIQSRLNNLQGKMYIDSKKARGTIVDIDIPLQR